MKTEGLNFIHLELKSHHSHSSVSRGIVSGLTKFFKMNQEVVLSGSNQNGGHCCLSSCSFTEDGLCVAQSSTIQYINGVCEALS